MKKKKRSKQWKALEKHTAEFLGGERTIRTDYGISQPDGVGCGEFVPECKWRSKLPEYLKQYMAEALIKRPLDISNISVIKIKSSESCIAMFYLADIYNLKNSIYSVIIKERAKLPYLARVASKQAIKYKTGLIPLVVLKEKGMHGEFAFMPWHDFCEYIRGNDNIKEVD